MRFKTWINEGFGVNSENMPEPFRKGGSIGVDSVPLGRYKQKLVQSLYDSNAFDFHPEDRPQDFINVNTINDLQVMKPTQGLTSFRSEILYGMQFTVNKNLKSELSKECNTLKTQIEDLQRRRVDADKNGNEQQRQIVYDTYNDITQKGVDVNRLKEIFPQMAQTRLKSAGLETKANQQWTINKLMNIVKMMKQPHSERDSSAALERQIEELNPKYEKAVRDLESLPKIENIIQQAFLKKIKHPSTPDDNKLCDHFVRLAVDNYFKFRKGYRYDYVLYPESSSSLNTKIATSLASQYGAIPIQGFQKIANPQIDKTSYTRQYPNNSWQDTIGNDGKNIKSGYHSIFNALSDTMDRSEGQTKNIKNNRPYIRNFKMNANIPQQVSAQDQRSGLKNRRLLVIDDNTASGGTFQQINHILQDIGPQSVHYYTPLRANFTYGSNKEAATDVPVPKKKDALVAAPAAMARRRRINPNFIDTTGV